MGLWLIGLDGGLWGRRWLSEVPLWDFESIWLGLSKGIVFVRQMHAPSNVSRIAIVIHGVLIQKMLDLLALWSILASASTEQAVQPLAHAASLQLDGTRFFKGLSPVFDLVECSACYSLADGLVLARIVQALAVLKAGEVGVLYLAMSNGERHLQLGFCQSTRLRPVLRPYLRSQGGS